MPHFTFQLYINNILFPAFPSFGTIIVLIVSMHILRHHCLLISHIIVITNQKSKQFMLQANPTLKDRIILKLTMLEIGILKQIKLFHHGEGKYISSAECLPLFK